MRHSGANGCDPKTLIFAGSTRQGSYSKQLALASAELACECGLEPMLIDLVDFPAAIFNEDDEAKVGVPESMQKLREMIRVHDAVLVVTPEYNGHIPPLLSNVFAWTSRPLPIQGPEQVVYYRKPMAVMATSPGRLGGVRVIPRLRDALAELGCIVAPGFVNLPQANQSFDAAGHLTVPAAEAGVKSLLGELQRLATPTLAPTP